MKRERRAYKYLIPAAMFISVAVSVVLWNYIGSSYEDMRSSSVTGILKALVRDPVFLSMTGGTALLLFASFISAVKAVKERLPAGGALLLLLAATVASEAAIIYTAISGIAG